MSVEGMIANLVLSWFPTVFEKARPRVLIARALVIVDRHHLRRRILPTGCIAIHRIAGASTLRCDLGSVSRRQLNLSHHRRGSRIGAGSAKRLHRRKFMPRAARLRPPPDAAGEPEGYA